jgi:aryl-alcohol dehydrogenase-like predicted oxidoreductase
MPHAQTTPTTFAIGGDLKVDRLGFGAMRITGPGVWGPPADHATAIAVLRRAVELGVNLVDTADSYGPYVSEELIAEALAPYRDGLVVATKAGLERPGPGEWRPSCAPARILACCDASLQRLRVDRIDLFQLHTVDDHVPYEDSVGALAELQREGKVRHVGLSNVTVEHVERARELVDVVTVQNRFNLEDRHAEDVLDYCEREGIGFIPWFPLAAGSLAEGSGVVAEVAREHGATTSQVALAWLLRRSPVMLPIPGTGSIEHLEENVGARELRLSDEQYDRIDAASQV